MYFHSPTRFHDVHSDNFCPLYSQVLVFIWIRVLLIMQLGCTYMYAVSKCSASQNPFLLHIFQQLNFVFGMNVLYIDVQWIQHTHIKWCHSQTLNAWSIPFLNFYSSIIIQEMKVLTNKVSDEQIWTWVIICYIIHQECAPVSMGGG